MQMLSSLEMFDENNLVALGKKRAGIFKNAVLNFESVNQNILSYAAQETFFKSGCKFAFTLCAAKWFSPECVLWPISLCETLGQHLLSILKHLMEIFLL